MNTASYASADALTVQGDDVHLWLVPCRISESSYAQRWALLDDDEHQRANRYRFDSDRQRFVASRGALRYLLGKYLDRDPADLRFALIGNGKPRIAGQAHVDLRFNVSDSGDYAMFAFALSREVGVDIEQIEARRANPRVAERFFSVHELRVLNTLSGDAWFDGFFNCWTRKEAFIKVTGEGLSRPLRSFDVALVPDEPARLCSVDGSESAARAWQMRDLRVVSGYAGALAVEGRIGALALRHFASGDLGEDVDA